MNDIGASRTRRSSTVAVARMVSAALLATLLSALIALADHMLNTWSNGSLMLALLVLWLVVFAGIALFGRAVSRFAMALVTGFQAWSERVAQEDADEYRMGLPRSDARVMADVDAALMHDDQEGVATRLVVPVYYR